MTKTVLAVFACSLCLSKTALSLELRLDAFEPKSPTLSLLDEPREVPNAMHDAVAAEVSTELSDSAHSFLADVEARATDRNEFVGGGQPAPENAWLAFVLGLIGFGLGHFVVAGDSRGGTRWLVIDIVFVAAWIVLDVLFGVLYENTYGGWGLWWLIFDLVLPVGWIVEHVFQGMSAYRAATGRNLFGDSHAPATDGEVANEPNRIVPPIFAWSF
jgi:hypothetical protein